MTSSHQVGSRAAGPSIRGYVYQFDRTVIEILRASRDSVVTVEGCEDIDIDNDVSPESIQCKYLHSTKYSLAELRSVLLPMLRAFNDGRRWQYRLYAYYSDGVQAPAHLTLQELKTSLTEIKRKPARVVNHYEDFSEEVLKDFLQHFTITSGNSFVEQRKEVLQALCENISSTFDDARDLDYGNAIAYVMELAIRPTEVERKITKKDFISQVNKRQMLFGRWQEEVLGRARIIKMMKKRFKTSYALRPRNRRTLVLDGQDAAQIGRASDLSHLIEILATEHYGPGQLTTAKPWTVVIEGANSDIDAIKAGLINKEIKFNDGYESIFFSPAAFDEPPVTNTINGGSKISKASYTIRVIGSDTYLKYIEELKSPDLIISLSDSLPLRYTLGKVPHEFQLQVTDIEEMMILLRSAR